MASLIECGKYEVLEESFTTQRNHFYPVGMHTTSGGGTCFRMGHTRLADLCRTGSRNISKKDRILRRHRRAILSCSVQIGLGRPLSSSRVHPAKQQESLYHTRSTERPGQCPPWAPQPRGVLTPSDSFSLIRPSPGRTTDHHLLRVQRHSLHDVFFVSTVSQPRLPPKFHVQVGLRDKRIQRTTTFFRRNYFIQDACPSLHAS